MKYSLVMPIHNEEKILPITFPYILRLKPDELILLFDRCTDNSFDIIYNMLWNYKFMDKTRIFFFNEYDFDDYKFRIAGIRRIGFYNAKYDIIFNIDADIIVNNGIDKFLKLFNNEKVGIISFEYDIYPFKIQNFMSNIHRKIFKRKRFCGQYLFRRKAWYLSEDIRIVKKLIRSEDSYLKSCIERKYLHLNYRISNWIHLRPKENYKNHYTRGFMKYSLHNENWLKCIWHSFIFFRFRMIIGYYHAWKRRFKYE